MPHVKPVFGTPINLAHPLAQGLTGCWLINENAGTILYDSIERNNITLSGSPLPTWTSGVYGSALSFPTQLSNTEGSVTISTMTLPLSYMIAFKPVNVGVHQQFLFSIGASLLTFYIASTPTFSLYNGA